MGFLLGAFGKLAAGSRYRSLQARMMRIQSRLRCATRQAADMEKMIARQEKTALNSLSMQANMYSNSSKQALMSSIFGNASELMSKVQGQGIQSLTQDETSQYQNMMSQFNQASSTVASNIEMMSASNKQQIQDYFEQLREMQLEPLKQEEDMLQMEKDSLESQIQIAKMDYEACQKMEQSDAKMLAPNYTAG